MDEVHYLADRFRGAVWEEVIIHLPESVTLVALSATVSNAEEFGAWIETVRGPTEVVVSEHRPVPLWQQVMAGRQLFDLFADDDHRRVNPELQRMARDEERLRRLRGHRPRAGGAPGPAARRSRVGATSSRPCSDGTCCPAIYFVFSRAGCDAAVQQLLQTGVRLTDPDRRAEIRQVVEERTAHLSDDDLRVLEYGDFLDGLERGFAAHHAGLLPVFKEVVEDLFARGLVMCVFATETLALGVNMPARTVVIERLTKWNGEAHVEVTAAEYTQLTGRAGRRGIDVEGDAVVLWQPGFDPQQLAGLASTRTYPLRSSFRPTYNMAVNLVRQMGRHTAREVLETSFAQFQADRAVVGLARQLRKNEEALAGYAEAMSCHLGDFVQYASLRRAISDREKQLTREDSASRKAEVARAVEQLQPGDVVPMPGGGRRGGRLGVVIERGGPTGFEGSRPVVLTEDRQVRKLVASDFADPPEPLERLKLPKGFRSRDAQARRTLAGRLRDLDVPSRGRRRRGSASDDETLLALRAELRAHPCHGCAEREDHARWAERWQRLRRETQGLQKRVDDRTGSIARTFDRVVGLLDQIGYLDGDTVTRDGERLTRLYTEMDLVAAEALRHGLWKGLHTRPSWRPRSRCWSTRRGGTQGRRRSSPAEPVAPRSRRPCGWRTTWRPSSATTGCRRSGTATRGSPGRRSGGPAGTGSSRCCTRASWPPATSCAGASSSSTCSGRWPPPATTTSCPPRRAPRSARCAAAWWRRSSARFSTPDRHSHAAGRVIVAPWRRKQHADARRRHAVLRPSRRGRPAGGSPDAPDPSGRPAPPVRRGRRPASAVPCPAAVRARPRARGRPRCLCAGSRQRPRQLAAERHVDVGSASAYSSASMVGYCATTAMADFSPTPRTPGRPSDGSPRRVAKSA